MGAGISGSLRVAAPSRSEPLDGRELFRVLAEAGDFAVSAVDGTGVAKARELGGNALGAVKVQHCGRGNLWLLANCEAPSRSEHLDGRELLRVLADAGDLKVSARALAGVRGGGAAHAGVELVLKRARRDRADGTGAARTRALGDNAASGVAGRGARGQALAGGEAPKQRKDGRDAKHCHQYALTQRGWRLRTGMGKSGLSPRTLR